MSEELLAQMLELALESCGCVKFDLKAYDEGLHTALTGASNRRTLENFARAGRFLSRQRVPPLLIASTLLVPGYIDVEEIRSLAGFVASVDRQIPYSLLAFRSTCVLSDLPATPRSLAEECLAAARSKGLAKVRIGNRHPLL